MVNTRKNINGSKKVLVDSWYGAHLGDYCVRFDDVLNDSFPKGITILAQHSAFIRGILLFFLSRRYSLVVLMYQQSGVLTFLLFAALFHKKERNVVLLEFIRGGRPTFLLKRFIYFLWLNYFLQPTFRKTIKFIHVLTPWEIAHYAALYCLPEERFICIPWPQRSQRDQPPSKTYISNDFRIMSSGRSACDWETLFRACEGQDWRLQVVCSRKDLSLINKLNRGNFATVMCDISKEEHQKLLEAADVYVLCLYENERSAGHIRISNAIRAGTPIIASAVKGIQGYLDHGKTAYLVPPKDFISLRVAIDKLLANGTYCNLLAKRAFEVAGNRTREQYFDMIDRLVRRSSENFD